MAQQSLVGYDLTAEASRPRSVGLLGTGDESDSETSSRHHTTFTRHIPRTFMPPAGFERAIPETEGPQTHALDCAVIMLLLSPLID